MSAKKYFKRYANRRARRAKDSFRKGNGHKKVYDLWWSLY